MTAQALYYRRVITIKEACKALQISYPTLRTWLLKLQIEPRRHPVDRRFYVLEDSEVEQVRALRADKPATMPPTARPQRRQEASPARNAHQPVPPRERRQRPVRASDASKQGDTLPAGWVAFSSWCLQHNVNQRSAYRTMGPGELPSPHHAPDGLPWRRGQYEIKTAYDAEQHLEANAYAATTWPKRFRPSCKVCQPEE
jgi:predicted DNA-binding transcriptional regulator AlpA